MSGKAEILTIENKVGKIAFPARTKKQQFLVHRSTIPCLVKKPLFFRLIRRNSYCQI